MRKRESTEHVVEVATPEFEKRHKRKKLEGGFSWHSRPIFT